MFNFKPVNQNIEEDFTAIDRHFSVFIDRMDGRNDPDIRLAAALLSRCAVQGDTCLDLQRWVNDQNRQYPKVEVPVPDLETWVLKLVSSPAVGVPGQRKPLIMDKANRLYLHRYWEYESTVIKRIKEISARHIPKLNREGVAESTRRLFPETGSKTEIDWQMVATYTSVVMQFSVISGGPGTGKTTTIAKVLAVLLENSDARRKLNIHLCAPTGKAAARLKESLIAAREKLNCSEAVKSRFPVHTGTIHRVLKTKTNSPYFHHNSSNPLPADVVIVDEASMVDLALMAKLLNALPAGTKLILVGDKDQLSSVEAGSVLGDICNGVTAQDFSEPLRKQLATDLDITLPQIGSGQKLKKTMQDHIVLLEKSYRFDDKSGIGRLSRAVRYQDAESMTDLLETGCETVSYENIADPGRSIQSLKKLILEGYRPFLLADNPEDALALFHQFKIICAVKSGIFGLENLNRLAESVLTKAGLISTRVGQQWYAGRPVMITSNDYRLGLFNGDIGIARMAEDAGAGRRLYVYFTSDSGKLRRFSPHRLPPNTTAFAMTVHKSQGSEFDQVCLALPEYDSPLLTCELLYTGITRARKSISIWGDVGIIKKAVGRRIQRNSGLGEALWG